MVRLKLNLSPEQELLNFTCDCPTKQSFESLNALQSHFGKVHKASSLADDYNLYARVRTGGVVQEWKISSRGDLLEAPQEEIIAAADSSQLEDDSRLGHASDSESQVAEVNLPEAFNLGWEEVMYGADTNQQMQGWANVNASIASCGRDAGNGAGDRERTSPVSTPYYMPYDMCVLTMGCSCRFHNLNNT